MPIIIHKIDASPPARAALMVAELLKLNYTTEEVNVILGDNRKPEFLEKNPLHTIPLLEDGDFILADSHAIITYLVSKYGADKRAELYPNDYYLRATIDQRMYFDATLVFPIIRSIVGSVVRNKATGLLPEQIASAEEVYESLETYLKKTKFVAGNHLTVADISLVASISSLDAFIPVNEKFEKIHAWWNNLKEEEWYQKMNVPGLEILENFVKQLMEKNSAA